MSAERLPSHCKMSGFRSRESGRKRTRSQEGSSKTRRTLSAGEGASGADLRAVLNSQQREVLPDLRNMLTCQHPTAHPPQTPTLLPERKRRLDLHHPQSRNGEGPDESLPKRHCRGQLNNDAMDRYLKLKASDILSCESTLLNIQSWFTRLIEAINAGESHNREEMILKALKIIANICKPLESDAVCISGASLALRDKAEAALCQKVNIFSGTFLPFWAVVSAVTRSLPYCDGISKYDFISSLQHVLAGLLYTITFPIKDVVSFLPLDELHGTLKQLCDSSSSRDFKILYEQSLQLLHKRDNLRSSLVVSRANEDAFVLLPSRTDLMSTSVSVKNKPSFPSNFEYLKTHFELLRQDFIRPLCSVLRDLQESTEEYYEDDEYISGRAITFQNVQFRNKDVCGGDLVYKAHFSLPKSRKVNWDHSKRFTYGSLLCLSHDNFHTLLFATIASRDVKELKNGIITIKVLDQLDSIKLDPRSRYKMIESPAYFEAYSSVVNQLHVMMSNPDNSLPDLAERHLVKSNTEVQMPLYAQVHEKEQEEGGHYVLDLEGVLCHCNRRIIGVSCPHGYSNVIVNKTDFIVDNLDDEIQDTTSPIVIDIVAESDTNSVSSGDSSIIFEEIDQSMSVINESQAMLDDQDSNPPPFTERLDESQVAALRLALSSEVALIQGPPGTGKTYIGIQFVKAMLQNRRKWNSERAVPILIMCQTNHALDQFLEGILNLGNRNIVRIGGRSKSEKIRNEKLNIKDKKQEIRHERKGMRRTRQHGSWHNNDPIFPVVSFNREDFMLIKCKYEALEELCYGSLPYNELNKMLYYSFLHPNELINCYNGCAIHKRLKEEGISSIGGILRWFGIETQNEGKSEDYLANYDTDSEEDERRVDAEEDRNAKLEGAEVLKKTKNEKDLVNFLKKLQRTESSEYHNSRQLRRDQKRELLKACLSNQCKHLHAKLHNLEERKKLYEEENEAITLQALRQADIVGVTTTGASIKIKVLQKLRSKIVIVEEAAEVMEGYIVAALTKHIEHLVLIGDHKQLRPKANDFTIGRKHGLEISLFERLINKGLPSVQLKYQHRMRPEIAELVRPHIYKELCDHQKVMNYGPIKGMKKNMFFVHHKNPEKPMEGLMSPANSHEAVFVIRLAKYLSYQGYKSDQITILTPYTGQVACIKEHLKVYDFESPPRVVPVDNFQGEENDIIILSLVRSVKSGFMKEENRICVALSRARQGLYVIGNFALFKKESKTWKSIINSLNKEYIGLSLPLQCYIHKHVTEVTLPDDFNNVIDGGCSKNCGFRLQCGHVCSRQCHPDDQDHEQPCLKPCCQTCPSGHHCPKLCSERCPPCKVPVLKTIPDCSHVQFVPCHLSPEEFTCKEECRKMLKCGHKCKKTCGERCTNECRELVKKMLPCGHEAQTECFRSPDDHMTRCRIPCGEELTCGHICQGTCGSCNQGRLHIPCKEKCTRTLLCGHQCSSKNCAMDCPPCGKKCPSSCPHGSCGHTCNRPCISCAELCLWECPHQKCTKACGEICDRPRCDEPCQLTLKCGHPCLGLCFEPCPPVCRVCDPSNDAFTMLFGEEGEPESRFIMLPECSHVFEVSNFDKYMETTTDDGAVKWKCCPRCQKTISAKSFRYSTIIKNIKKDMNAIKEKECKKLRDADRENMRSQIVKWNEKVQYCSTTRHIEKLPDVSLQALHICIALFLESRILLKKFLELSTNADYIRVRKQIHRLCDFITSRQVKSSACLPQQVINDIHCEIRRIRLLSEIYEVKEKPKPLQSLRDWRKFEEKIGELNPPSYKLDIKVTDETYKKEHEELFQFCRKHSLDRPTLDEIRQIVAVLGTRKGSWYKCPNGHYYTIGECGGAMQTGKCIECGVKVGGSSHRLLADNEHAGEIDNTQHAAWSEGANLNNYDLRNIV